MPIVVICLWNYISSKLYLFCNIRCLQYIIIRSWFIYALQLRNKTGGSSFVCISALMLSDNYITLTCYHWNVIWSNFIGYLNIINTDISIDNHWIELLCFTDRYISSNFFTLRFYPIHSSFWQLDVSLFIHTRLKKLISDFESKYI